MQQWKVRAASQADGQTRETTITAESEAEAVARVEAAERSLAEYNLIPSAPEKPDEPSEDSGLEDWEAYDRALAEWENADANHPARVQEGEQRLAYLQEHAVITEEGKVTGVKGRDRALLHAHLQDRPYVVESVTEVKLDDEHVSRLVGELTQLSQDKRAWKKALKDLKEAGVPMAAVSGFLFGIPVKNQYDGTAVTNFSTDTMKVSLHTVSYVPSQDTHAFFSSITNEITGTGYTAGGLTLTSKTVTYDSATDQARLDAADAVWTTSTLTARYACVYKSTGTAATSPVVGLVDFGADVSTAAGTFQIVWDVTGIVVFDVT